jgi:hypothetical protein
MATKLKFGNKPFYFDAVTHQTYPKKVNENCVYFDSQLEFKIYQNILALVDSRWVKRQHKLLIKPQTETYPEIAWKVDFRIEVPYRLLLNIEVKGQWIKHSTGDFREFKRMLQVFEYFNKTEYEQTVVVSDSCFDIDHRIKTISPIQLTQLIQQGMGLTNGKATSYTR